MPVELKVPTEQVENVRVGVLKKVLEAKFGEDWTHLENETISLEMGLLLTRILNDKIYILKILTDAPQMANNVHFFLYLCEVLSNIPADFEVFPHPNSLQIAWALHELKEMGIPPLEDGVKHAVTHILMQEGYSSAPGILFEACFPEKLKLGGEPEDRDDKASAVEKYIEYMRGSE